MSSIERPASDFAAILKPLGYRKRKVWVRPASKVTLSDLNWSGGTRSEYRAFAIGGTVQLGSMARWNQVHPWDNAAEGKSIEIPAGAIVVRTGHFCGKESMATIYVNPADMPRLLPQTTA